MPSHPVVFFPFHTEGTSWRELDSGLMHLLGIRVSGNGDLRRINTHVILERLQKADGAPLNVDSAARLARELGAKSFVLGKAHEEGRRLRLTAHWHDLDGTAREEVSVEGDSRQLTDLVDQMCSRLVDDQIDPQKIRIARVAVVTSNSPGALQAYFEGEAALQRRDHALALEYFTAAVSHDPQFALAYLRLAEVARWMGQKDRFEQARQSALLLSNRLPVLERQVLEAELDEMRHDTASARERCRILTRAMPDEWEAWLCLSRVGAPAAEAETARLQAHRLFPAVP